jgi:hypothetical protein
MKRLIALAVTLVLGSNLIAQLRAGAIQLTDPSQLSPSDTTAIYTGVDGDQIASPYVLAATGNILTFSTTGTDFTRVDEGTSWIGAFPNGTKLLWDVNSNDNIGGPVTVSFANPLHELGLSVQQDNAVDTTFNFQAFNGNTSLGTFSVTVPDSGPPSVGNTGFLGVQASGSDVITSLVISSTDSVNSSFNNDFAMGPVTFGNQVIPEPSSIVLASISSVGMVVYGWRRRQRASTTLINHPLT